MKKRVNALSVVFLERPELYCSFLWVLNCVAWLRQLPYPLAHEYFVPSSCLFRLNRLTGRYYGDGRKELDACLDIFPNLGVDCYCTVMDKIYVVNGFVNPIHCEIGMQLDDPGWSSKLTAYAEVFIEGRCLSASYMMQRELIGTEVLEIQQALEPIVDFSFLTEEPLYRDMFVEDGVFVVEEDYGALVAA